MPLTNMKMSKKEAKVNEGVEVNDSPRYPWGLSINLDEESLSKLGMSKLPDVGDQKMLVAFVDVTDKHESDSQDGKKRKSIRLQITDMSIEEKVKPDKLKTLYDNGNKK